MSSFGRALGKIFRREKKEEYEEGEAGESYTKHSVVYLKALPLRNLSDVEVIKQEVKAGNILIVKVTPLARKSVEDVKKAVNELCEFTDDVGGDIARLGEERVVICPSGIKIWRELPKNSVGG